MSDATEGMKPGEVGYYNAPPDPENYDLREDGKWYHAPGSPLYVSAPAGIGDVNSNEKGSGARYNHGKPPMQYIPFRQQMIAFASYLENRRDIWSLMRLLSMFEEGIDSAITAAIRDLEMSDLREAAYVWEYGAKKYAAWNWAKGMPWSVPLACISRHIQDIIILGEEYDHESSRTHWGHIVCNLLMLEHYSNFYLAGDDRPPREVFIE